MVSWDDFATAEPALAAFGFQRLHHTGMGFGYLATIRHADGGPRVHPVCPFLAGGRLYVTIPRRSPKRLDLRADERYMLHVAPSDEDEEFAVRGSARLVEDTVERAAAADACPFATGVRHDDDLFELRVDRADATRWANRAQADTYPIRMRWDG